MTESKNTRVKIWLLAITFAILISIPFLIPHCGFISLFALVPLFLMENMISEHGVRNRFLYFYSAFLLFNIATTFWVWNASAAGSVAAMMLNALQMSVIFAIFSFIKGRLEKKWIAYAAFTSIWLAWEHIYFNVQLTWPWLVLGNAFATSPYLVQWYEVTGALGGSLWILLSNIFLYFFLTNHKKSSLVAFLLTALIPIAVSLTRYYTYTETDDPVEVLAIQPNIDPYEKFGVIPQATVDNRFIELAEINMTPKTKYVISPETFTYNLDIDRPQINSSYRTYMGFLENHPDVTLVLGALTQEIYLTKGKPTKSARPASDFWYDVYNSALTINSNGILGYHHKSKLVPAVERIPFADELPFIGKIVEKFGVSPYSYGISEKVEPLPCTDGNYVGTMICYESVYGEHSRKLANNGATFLAIITNDGWWGDTPGHIQHFRYASLRAIEMRRDIVRAANTGISGLIDQKGCVKCNTGYWVETTLKGDVNINRHKTFYTIHGDMIGLTACWMMIAVLILLVYVIFKKRK